MICRKLAGALNGTGMAGGEGVKEREGGGHDCHEEKQAQTCRTSVPTGQGGLQSTSTVPQASVTADIIADIITLPSSILRKFFSFLEISERKILELRWPTL